MDGGLHRAVDVALTHREESVTVRTHGRTYETDQLARGAPHAGAMERAVLQGTPVGDGDGQPADAAARPGTTP